MKKTSFGYKALLRSADLNQRFGDLFGGSILNGFRLHKGTSQFSVSIRRDNDEASVLLTPEGIRLEETEDVIDALTLRPNTATGDRFDVIYANYEDKSENATFRYEVMEGVPGQAVDVLKTSNTRMALGYVKVKKDVPLDEANFTSFPFGLSARKTVYSEEMRDMVNTSLIDVKAAVDRANEAALSTRMNWKTPVNQFADIATTYTSPKNGDVVMVKSTGSVYKYTGISWEEIQANDPFPLNNLETRISTQLAETAKVSKQNKISTPTVVFIDDDGSSDFLTKLKPIFDANGEKCSIAVNTSKIGTTGFMTLAQLKTLQDEGFEILNHGKNHQSMDSLGNNAARFEEVVTAQQYLKENGFTSWEHFVLANGTNVNKTAASFSFLKRYVKGAVNTGPLSGSSTAVNNVPIEQYSIHRQHTPDHTLAQLTAEVDKGIATNGLIVFFTHAQQTVMTSEKLNELDQLIKYIQSNSVPIVSLDKALETFGNIIDTDTGGTGIKVSNTGKSNIKQANVIFVPYLAAENFNDSITTFTSETVTRAIVASSQAASSPTPGVAGVLVTAKNNSQNAYNFQEWYPVSSDKFYRRRVSSGGTWQSWRTFTAVEDTSSVAILLGTGIGVNTKMVTDYALNTITIEACSSANNPGLPNSSSGTLKTYRISDQSAYCYQEFTARTGVLTHKRFGKSDNSWDVWVQV